jgi:hypothetical protein
VIFLRCALAEWQLVRARLLRSRLGLWLALLAAGGVARSATADPRDLVEIVVRVAMLGGVLGVAFAAGSDADRAALALTLTHPTSPGAVAVGRWLGATTAACLASVPVLGVALARGAGTAGPLGGGGPGLAAVFAGGAAAAAALPGVWLGGNVVALLLFLYVAFAGGPGTGVLHAGSPHVAAALGAAALAVAPAAGRYQGLAAGDPMAWLHAAAWILGGSSAGALLLARRVRPP